LVEERLEEVVVRAIDQGDVHRRVGKTLGCGKSAEAGPHNDYALAIHAEESFARIALYDSFDVE
jgi:hypothetical protein